MCADNKIKNLFSLRPMASFRGARKLSSYLVRGKVHPLESKIGSSSCGKKRCQFCLNVTESDSFTSTTANNLFNCSERCLVYLLTCWVCLK